MSTASSFSAGAVSHVFSLTVWMSIAERHKKTLLFVHWFEFCACLHWPTRCVWVVSSWGYRREEEFYKHWSMGKWCWLAKEQKRFAKSYTGSWVTGMCFVNFSFSGALLGLVNTWFHLVVKWASYLLAFLVYCFCFTHKSSLSWCNRNSFLEINRWVN